MKPDKHEYKVGDWFRVIPPYQNQGYLYVDSYKIISIRGNKYFMIDPDPTVGPHTEFFFYDYEMAPDIFRTACQEAIGEV